jgi:hypothetical protein
VSISLLHRLVASFLSPLDTQETPPDKYVLNWGQHSTPTVLISPSASPPQDYALSPDFSEEGDKLLMSSSEYSSSLEFQTQRIYQRLSLDWQEDSLEQIQKWFVSWNYHDVPEETLELWRALYQTHREKEKASEEHQRYLCDRR